MEKEKDLFERISFLSGSSKFWPVHIFDILHIGAFPCTRLYPRLFPILQNKGVIKQAFRPTKYGNALAP